MKIEGKLMHVNPYLSSTNNWAQMERNSIKKCRTVMTNKILVLRIKLLLLLSLLYRRHLKKKHIILSMLFHLQIKQRKYQIYSFLFSFPSYFLTYYILEGSIFLSLSLLLLFSLFVPPTKTLKGIYTKFQNLWDAKIKKNIHQKKIITHKIVFTWFGNWPMSTELQGFHYSQGKNTKCGNTIFSLKTT